MLTAAWSLVNPANKTALDKVRENIKLTVANFIEPISPDEGLVQTLNLKPALLSTSCCRWKART